jgi:hypothetical protein
VDFWQEANSVNDREALSNFLLSAARDFTDNPEGWENADISALLEAMSAWVSDCDEVFRRSGKPLPSGETWATVAKLVAAARVYE